MDKTELLAKLESRTPLFETIPTVSRKRIIGTESEYGVQNSHKNGTSVIEYDRLPSMLHNGGEIYEDRGHVEYASPETSNPAASVAYYEAGKVICWREQYSPELYCNNNDWNGNTFGSHESYFTCAPRAEWHRLIPFLIARTVLCGAGWLNTDNRFELSQRAHMIQCAQGIETTTNRPILNLRREPLAQVEGFERLHIVCADANMSEVSTFLRLGTMSCVIEMLEIMALPEVTYNYDLAASDLHNISGRKECRLHGVINGPSVTLELLALYLDRSKELFSNRDAVTDAVLVIWEDTVQKLAKNPTVLWRRLDWVAKSLLLRIFEEEMCLPTGDELRSQDLAYHNLNPAEGLYYYLVQKGEMERIVSDEVIIHASFEPPADTRGYARGKVVQLLEEQRGNLALCTDNWKHLSLVNASENGFSRMYWGLTPHFFISLPMNDPRETYAHLVEKIRKEFV